MNDFVSRILVHMLIKFEGSIIIAVRDIYIVYGYGIEVWHILTSDHCKQERILRYFELPK